MNSEKRLIDANALTDKLEAHHDFFVNAYGGFSNLPIKDKARVDEITNCIAEITNAPTVDAVEVVHGRWTRKQVGKYTGVDEVCCSICGDFIGVVSSDTGFEEAVKGMNYCPNCGAKMDGGKNGKNR